MRMLKRFHVVTRESGFPEDFHDGFDEEWEAEQFRDEMVPEAQFNTNEHQITVNLLVIDSIDRTVLSSIEVKPAAKITAPANKFDLASELLATYNVFKRTAYK